ncbi:MAG: SufD family Fe-S cluster assembly protein [Patescibacteria group bacterium]
MTTFIDLNKDTQRAMTFSEKGKYVVFMHNLSGKFVFEITSEGVELDIFGLFTGTNEDNFSVETIQHHKAPGSTSNLLIKGVFNDKSKFHYQGLIRIEKNGQKSHAYQKNQNLILSPDTFVESKPFLEILTNDVFCTHGSTTGKLNKDQLFYAKSRGLDSKTAESLLVEGFVNEVYDKVKEKVPNFIQ